MNYKKRFYSLFFHYITITPSAFATEPALERSPKHPEDGCVSISQSGGSRRRAAFVQLRVLRVTRNRLHSHIQQLIQGAAWKDPGLPF